MFMNKNILPNIKRIDKILSLCSDNPQLVHFPLESLNSYRNKQNLRKYKHYFELYKKYKKIFLDKKKDINNSMEMLHELCQYFFVSKKKRKKKKKEKK
ncbi:hypothetical protein PFLG_00517 [Plasmodium falciparum RAJ116]|uniref:Uncharacterized protein n=1 Tax=Plasmodium falciparum RAJ116 TaxID=580058 RepID=A0A0L0CTJ1_PLAFA|nr:hypothetical protein PFLG_00517 [Plasmodium falciparum RAJ116]